MSRVLVIGGTLFMGRELVRRLLARGEDVTILHRGNWNPFEGKTGEIVCDRNDPQAIARAVSRGRFDIVFDNVYDWQRGTTAEQVEVAARACSPHLRRYIFTSSVAAYGAGLDHDEDDPLAPPDYRDAYSRNKAETERMLLELHAETGFPAVTLRPPYVYGPENPFYREQFFWDRILAGRPVIVPGDGSRLMQFVYRDDYVRACLLAMDNDRALGRAYNIAHPRAIPQTELVESLALAAGRPVPIVLASRELIDRLGGKQFEPPFYFGQYYDMPPVSMRTSRAERDLGFRPTPLGQALRQTFESYLAQPRPEPDFSFDDRVLAAMRRAY